MIYEYKTKSTFKHQTLKSKEIDNEFILSKKQKYLVLKKFIQHNTVPIPKTSSLAFSRNLNVNHTEKYTSFRQKVFIMSHRRLIRKLSSCY